MGSDRLVRQLCWALVVLAIISAIVGVGNTLALFVPFPNVPETTDLADRLAAFRAADAQLYPILLIGGVATGALFAVVALLGVALRPFASRADLRDVMATVLVVGGIVGIVAQAVNIGANNAATFGYCDCGYRTEELIAQDYALTLGFVIANWLSIGAILLTAIGVALAGRVIQISSTWRMLSYAIAVIVVAAVLVRMLASLVFIDAFDPFQVTDLVIALVSAILVPIWAIILARSIHNLRIRTTGIAASPAADA